MAKRYFHIFFGFLLILSPQRLQAGNCEDFAAFLNERGILLEARHSEQLKSYIESLPKEEALKVFDRLNVKPGTENEGPNISTIVPPYSEMSFLRRLWGSVWSATMRFNIDLKQRVLSSQEKYDIVMVFLKSEMSDLFKKAYNPNTPLSLAEKRALILSVDRAWWRAAQIKSQRSLVNAGLKSAGDILALLYKNRTKKISPSYNPTESVTVENALSATGDLVNEKLSSTEFREEDIQFQEQLAKYLEEPGFVRSVLFGKPAWYREMLAMLQHDGDASVNIVKASIKALNDQIAKTPHGFARAEMISRRKVLEGTYQSLSKLFSDKESIKTFEDYLKDSKNEGIKSWLLDSYYSSANNTKKRTVEVLDNNIRNPSRIILLGLGLSFFYFDVIPNSATKVFDSVNSNPAVEISATKAMKEVEFERLQKVKTELDGLSMQFESGGVSAQEYARKVDELKARYPDEMREILE